MENYYYESYYVTLEPEYTLSDFIDENKLENAEIVQMFLERSTLSGHLEYLIIFKIPKNNNIKE